MLNCYYSIRRENILSSKTNDETMRLTSEQWEVLGSVILRAYSLEFRRQAQAGLPPHRTSPSDSAFYFSRRRQPLRLCGFSGSSSSWDTILFCPPLPPKHSDGRSSHHP